MTKAQQFWDWFTINNSRFLKIDNIDQKMRGNLLDEFLENLHYYDDSLFFYIGVEEDKGELVITAEGRVESFSAVEELVKVSPKYSNWVVVAFKPAIAGDFITDYEGAKIDTASSYFLPLKLKDKPDFLGVRLFVREYEEAKHEDFLCAAFEVLENILGEKMAADEINHIETFKLPDDYEQLALIELSKLKEYISFKNGR